MSLSPEFFLGLKERSEKVTGKTARPGFESFRMRTLGRIWILCGLKKTLFKALERIS
jgi:hypothetical protein